MLAAREHLDRLHEATMTVRLAYNSWIACARVDHTSPATQIASETYARAADNAALIAEAAGASMQALLASREGS